MRHHIKTPPTTNIFDCSANPVLSYSQQIIDKRDMNNYLASSEHAQPPAFQSAGILFQNGQDVSFSEGQFIWSLGDVVVQGPGLAILFSQKHSNMYTINIFIIFPTEEERRKFK